MKDFVKVAIWFIAIMFIADWAFELITMDSTIANIAGFALVIVATCLSVTTKCLTTITLKRKKNEKID